MNIFLGVDHGTSSIRFSFSDGLDETDFSYFELSRQSIAHMSDSDLLNTIERNVGCFICDISMSAVTYSMGDGIVSVESIHNVSNRGLAGSGGAGVSTGAGTRIFDLFQKHSKRAALLPGITTKSLTDPRFKIYSHQSSPEKIGCLYDANTNGFDNFILSDIGSNTVSLAVIDSKIVGGFDACVFAPGIEHGAIDLESLRLIDEGVISANEAFSTAGVAFKQFGNLRYETISLFAAMEISALSVLFGAEKIPFSVFLSGKAGEIPFIHKNIAHFLGKDVRNLGKWSAARGCCKIARDIFRGKSSILGLPVSENI